MRAFEIHIYQSGKWNIDSIFDERDLAMHEARRMDESGRYLGVRVIEEVFDEESEQATNRTIFRGSRIEQANAEHMERTKTARQNAVADRRRRKIQQDVQRRKKTKTTKNKKSDPVRLVVVFTLLGAFALGAMIGLQYLAGIF